jgi:hypothetical protein
MKMLLMAAAVVAALIVTALSAATVPMWGQDHSVKAMLPGCRLSVRTGIDLQCMGIVQGIAATMLLFEKYLPQGVCIPDDNHLPNSEALGNIVIRFVDEHRKTIEDTDRIETVAFGALASNWRCQK